MRLGHGVYACHVIARLFYKDDRLPRLQAAFFCNMDRVPTVGQDSQRLAVLAWERRDEAGCNTGLIRLLLASLRGTYQAENDRLSFFINRELAFRQFAPSQQ